MNDPTIRFDCTVEDYAYMLRRMSELNPDLLPRLWPIRFVTAGFIGLALYFLSTWLFSLGAPSGAAAGLAVALWVLWAFPRHMRRNLDKACRRIAGKQPALTPYEISLSAGGVRVVTPSVDAVSRWHTVRSVAQGPRCVEFRLVDGAITLVPNRAFESPDHAAAFIAQAEQLRQATVHGDGQAT
ncbi:MAG: hypothetical protein KF817_04835 [Phycisphaeraceae bacterium]|nr:hypothetical protein [Phycisphaeraceae bacterium]